MEYGQSALANEIQDTDPVISMDISLGKELREGEVVEVCYAALRETLDYIKAPSDSSDLTIVLEPIGEQPKHSKIYSSYTPSINTIRLTFNAKANTKFIQTCLQHEVYHYACHKSPQGKLDTEQIPRDTLMSKIIDTVADKIDRANLKAKSKSVYKKQKFPLLRWVASIAFNDLVCGLNSVSDELAYRHDLEEVQARKVAKANLTPVFMIINTINTDNK